MTRHATDQSEYGSELDWSDEALEAQLAAIEQASLNKASGHVEDGGVTAEELERGQGVVLAQRLADALRPFRVTREEEAPRSLWERFRKKRGWGALSCSDLVQHSYRLASKPYLPPLQRPASITTSTGASISIDMSRTVKREGVLDKGKAVHARIEKQVMGDVEPVKVEVEGKEEWWALRCLNTIVSLETLLATGRVREVPVVGFVREFLVFGVIDEIERREITLPPSSPVPTIKSARSDRPPSALPVPPINPPKAPSARPLPRSPIKSKPKAAETTPKKSEQRTLLQFFSPSPSLSKTVKGKEKALDQDAVLDLTEEGDTSDYEAGAQAPFEEPNTRSGFVLSDTKTRSEFFDRASFPAIDLPNYLSSSFNRSLPPKQDSRAARMQLMLYHSLFTSLLQPQLPPPAASAPFIPGPSDVSSAVPFPWSRLYDHLSLGPDASLSPSFLSSVAPVVAGSRLESSLGEAKTLGDFVAALGRYGQRLAGDRPLNEMLENEMEISYVLRDGGAGGWKGRWSGKKSRRARSSRRKRDAAAGAGSTDGSEILAEDEHEDLERALQLSLQDKGPNPSSADDLTPDSSAARDGTIDSQLEDSQAPFLANPSLPLPIPPPSIQEGLDTPSADLDVDESVLDLPPNPQAGHPDAEPPPPAVSGSLRPSRYGFRQRPAPPPTAETPAAPIVPPASASSPSRKRPRSDSFTKRIEPSQPSTAPAAPSSPSSDASASPTLIGIETFRNSPAELSAHLRHILPYWLSQREPIGVSETEVSRCRTCEFEEGCEWRATRAREAFEINREKRRRREAEAVARRRAREGK
ncbi:SPOSA6832_01401, partial [Sporobolomyces salmonicolor]